MLLLAITGFAANRERIEGLDCSLRASEGIGHINQLVGMRPKLLGIGMSTIAFGALVPKTVVGRSMQCLLSTLVFNAPSLPCENSAGLLQPLGYVHDRPASRPCESLGLRQNTRELEKIDHVQRDRMQRLSMR